ncbi:MAG: PAS-domain containing protein [Alphaproteobacteria bacterium]
MLRKLTSLFRNHAEPGHLVHEAGNDANRMAAENVHLKSDARRYANIINASLNPIWQRDEQLKIVYCNLAFSEAAEETADNVIAVGDLELYKGHTLLAQKAWATQAEQVERKHIIVGGERRLYLIREVPFPKEAMLIGYAKDITELEVAQEEIQRHIGALRDLLESSTSAMAIYGKDMRLKFYNFAFVALWKLDEGFLDSEPTYGELLEMLREKRKLPEQANFKAFKEQQQKLFTALIEPEEEFFYLPDGKTLRVIAIPHALGGILFAYEDVTDRLALERSYNTLIAVQRETLDNLHEGIVVFGENGRLTLCNPMFYKLWHLTPEFTASEPHMRGVFERCRALFVTDDWEKFLENLVARLQQRQFFALRFERADGSVVDCSCVPLPDGATLLSFIDVTASTLVERSLRERTEALEAADKLKTEFLANMSYELRSPLTSISGFAEMLKKEYVGPLNETQREYVGGIFESAQQLAALISDIIDLATIEAGYLHLEVTEFDLRKTIDSVLTLLSERVKLQNVSITVSVAPEVAYMQADEVRVKQILINLLSNAVKTSKSQGHIALEAGYLPLPTGGRGPLAITVRDDGAGMETSRAAQLFDPFHGAKQGPEAALGLSLVKRFVELHGGEVTVTSAPGKGTSITCTFPTPKQRAAA